MTTARTLVVCDQVQGEHWQLRGPSAAARVLVGWTVEQAQRRDARVPLSVASVLATSLTSLHHCAFFSSQISRLASQTHVITLPSSFWSRLLLGTPRQSGVVVTRDPTILCHSFEDDGFPWSLQGQLLLLGDSRLEQLSPRTAQALLQSPASFQLDSLEPAGIQLVVTPGVDGDVLAIFASAADTYQPLLSALHAHAKADGFEYLSLNEQEFASALAH